MFAASKNMNVLSLKLTQSEFLSGINSIARITLGKGISWRYCIVDPS